MQNWFSVLRKSDGEILIVQNLDDYRYTGVSGKRIWMTIVTIVLLASVSVVSSSEVCENLCVCDLVMWCVATSLKCLEVVECLCVVLVCVLTCFCSSQLNRDLGSSPTWLSLTLFPSFYLLSVSYLFSLSPVSLSLTLCSNSLSLSLSTSHTYTHTRFLHTHFLIL